MEFKIINRRFEIIEETKKYIPGFVEYLGMDKGNPVRLLYFEYANTTGRREFINMIAETTKKTSTFSVPNVAHTVGFYPVREINGELFFTRAFIYVAEYVKKRSIREVVGEIISDENINFSPLLDIAVSLFKILSYLEYMGVRWSFFSHENLFYRKINEKTEVLCLEDPVFAWLNMQEKTHFMSSFADEYLFIDTPLSYRSENEFLEISRLLLDYISDFKRTVDLTVEWNTIKRKLKDKQGLDEPDNYIFLQLLDKLINTRIIRKPYIYSDIIDGLNKDYLTSYSKIIIDENKNLRYSAISNLKNYDISDFNELESEIKKSDTNKYGIIAYGVNDSLSMDMLIDIELEFFVRGYYTFYFGGDQSEKIEKGFVRILRNFTQIPPSIREFGGKEVFLEVLINHTKSPFPTLDGELDPFYLRLVLMAAQFIKFNLPAKETVLLFDCANMFSEHILYVMFVLLTILDDKKIVMGMSVEGNALQKGSMLEAILNLFEAEKCLGEIAFEKPKEQNLYRFFRDFFNSRQSASLFSSFAWRKMEFDSDALMKSLKYGLERNFFSFNDEDFTVELLEDKNAKDVFMDFIKEQQLEETELAKMRSLSSKERMVLKKGSMLFLNHNLEELSTYYSMDKQELLEVLESLEKEGYIYAIENSVSKRYAYKSVSLKNKIKNLLTYKERKAFTKELIEKFPNIDFNIANKHIAELKGRDVKETSAIRKELEKYVENNNFSKQLECYEELLNYPLDDNEKFSIKLNIFKIYEFTKAAVDFCAYAKKMYLEIPKKIAPELLDFYYGLVTVYVFDAEKGLIKSAKEWIAKRRRNSKAAEIFYYIGRGNSLKDTQEFEEALKNYLSAIAACGDDLKFLSLRGDAKRFMGITKYFMGELDDAVTYSEDSILDCRTVRYISGELKARNNIASFYGMKKETRKHAMAQYEEILDIAKKYNINSVIALTFSNLAFFYEEYYNDAAMALEYARAANEANASVNVDVFNPEFAVILMYADLQTGNLRDAYEDYQRFIHNPFFSDNISGNYENYYDFLAVTAYMFFELRKFDGLKQHLDYSKKMETSDYSVRDSELSLFGLLLEYVDEEKDILDELLLLLDRLEADKENFFYFSLMRYLECVALFFYTNGDFEHYFPFAQRLVEISEFIWDKFYDTDSRSKDTVLLRVLVRGVNESSTEYLRSCFQKPSAHRSFITAAVVLAESYEKQGAFWMAVSWIFEAVNVISFLLRNISYDDRWNYAKYNNFALPLFYLKNFLRHKSLYCEGGSVGELSRDELEELVYNFDIYKVAIEHDVLKNLYEEQIYKSLELYPEASLIFGDNDRENMGVMLEFLANRLMTHEGYLCLIEQGEYKLTAKTKAADEKYFMEFKMRFNLNKLQVMKNVKLSSQEIQNILILPIYQETGFEKFEEEPVGVLIFMANRLLHFVSEEGLERIKSYGGLTSILLENDKLNRVKNIDRLTGAMTRGRLERMISEKISEAMSYKYPFTILMYDLDHFKNVNDTFGHLAGDNVLKTVSHEVMKLLPEGAALGRYGGEEFIVTLPNTDTEGGYHVAELLRKRIKQINFEELDGGTVTISLGIAQAGEKRDRQDSLILRADEALYQAKYGGRDMSVIWQKAILTEKMRYDRANRKYMRRMGEPLYRLAFIELLEELDKRVPVEVKLYNMLNRLSELMQGAEIRLALYDNDKPLEIYSVMRGDRQLHIDKDISCEWIEKFENRRDGYFTSSWTEDFRTDPVTGYRERNSLMILPVLENSKVRGALAVLADVREKEYDAEDFAIVRVFSSFFVKVIDELLMILYEER